MSSNKSVATILTALFLLPMLPSAAAQTAADLTPVSITTGDLIVGKPTTVTLTVRNIGGSDFQSNGWQVFWGYNGDSPNDCLQPSSVPAQSCYTRVGPTDSRSTVPAGEPVTLQLSWTPTRSIHAGSGRIHVRIEPFNAGVTTGTQGPDQNADNNVASFSVFVSDPMVRALPLRQASPSAEAGHTNQAWKTEEILDACLPTPTANQLGCRAQPGVLYSFAYLVKNEGNTQDAYTGTVRGNGGANGFDSRGWRFFFSPEVVTIAPKDEKQVNVLVFVPDNASSTDMINVNQNLVFVSWASSINPAITTNQPPTEACGADLNAKGLCKDPSIPSMLVGNKYAFRAVTNETFVKVYRDEVATLPVNVNNSGNTGDSYIVTLDRDRSTINDSWLPTLQTSTAFIQKDYNNNASISIRPPSNATRGQYVVAVTIQSDNSPETPVQRIAWTVDLQQWYGLSGGALTTFVRTVPAEQASYTLSFTNHGNGPDNVTLTLENVPASWQRSLSTTAFTVPAFTSVNLILNLTSPANTPADTNVTAYVNATSQGPIDQPADKRVKASIRALASVIRGPNIETTTPVPEAFIDPGSTRTFQVNVRNTGNVADNFTVTFQRQNPDWSVTIEPTTLALTPLQSGTVNVAVRAPTASDVGETTKVFTTFTSQVDPARTRTIDLNARVSGPDLFVENIALDRPLAYANEDIMISYVVGNRGNKEPATNTTVRLEYIKDGIPTPIGEEAPLGKDDLRGGIRRTQTVLWNTSGIEGAVLIRARIDVPNEIVEIDETPASNEATKAVTFRTNLSSALRLTAAEGLSGRAGERLVYGEPPNAFVIEYRGNQPQEGIRVTFESEHGWTLKTQELQLSPFSPVTLSAAVQIPAAPGVPTDALRITITPSNRPELAIRGSVITTIIDDEPPRFIEATVTPETATLGQEVVFNARVQDITGLAEVRVYVVLPSSGGGNVTESFALVPQADGTFRATRAFDVAGAHRWYVTARDNSAAANENTTKDAVRIVTINPGSAPKIELATNQSSTIRTGSPIQLSITDPLGISSVRYVIRGVTYDLARPFREIDTSGFTAGTVDMNITAENVYGVATSKRFAFTVDNTPPQIKSVAITPESPKINEETTVKVIADADTATVDVTIRRDGQVIESQRAVRKGSGTFELVFTPGEGTYNVDVTAKDAAGNPLTKADALSFATTSKGIPAPGLLLIIGLVAAIALSRRRAC